MPLFHLLKTDSLNTYFIPGTGLDTECIHINKIGGKFSFGFNS